MADLDILGIGPTFPTGTLNQPYGRMSTASGKELIQAAIKQILGTAIGERFMLPGFGSMLPLMVFEPNDLVLGVMVELYVEDALKIWERRIRVDQVSASSVVDEHRLDITIAYTIVATQETGNLVYPFYLEGIK